MSFASVYKSLQELFPQVDRRMLKAVAIEHTKDVDAAVEFILNEVLPSIDAPQDLVDGKDDKHLSLCSPEGPHTSTQDIGHLSLDRFQEQNQLTEHQEALEVANAGSSEARYFAREHGDDSHHASEAPDGSLTCLAEDLACRSVLNSHEGNYPDVSVTAETDQKHQENVFVGSHQSSHSVLSSVMNDDTVISECNDVSRPTADMNEPSVYSGTSHVANPNEVENIVAQLESFRAFEEVEALVEDVSESETTSSSNNRESEARVTVENGSQEMVLDSTLADLEEASFSTTVVTQSGQICRFDVLEDAIGEAKNNKKTLFLSMESVINMMREVEDLEKAAEHAKEEAAKGGLDIIGKVEDIRKMLLHAKEANDMHAGEVYGEKAILATEARELQSRLLNLSYERDSSLAILYEMRQTLEARLVVTEEVRKAAEQDKLEKEGSARKALVEQELIMEKVVQESKRLQSEAEENSKLQEFLMDRGQVVDMLQGEIAVICMDVKLLKENFDDRVPFSKSLSSSQTSCILASSGSSGKSLASSLVPEQVESSLSPKIADTTSVNNSFKESTSEGAVYVHKKIMDDDWDLFEDESELYKLH